MTISQSQLKELLHYDPDTGIFRWLKYRNKLANIGNIANSYDFEGYIQIKTLGKTRKAHRLAFLYMTGSFPKDSVDHINGIKDDNRWVNLREASNQENCFNKVKSKNNTSGFKGVVLNKKSNKWYAQTRLNFKQLHLGSFGTPEEASKAYQSFSKQHHGEFYNQHDIKGDKK